MRGHSQNHTVSLGDTNTLLETSLSCFNFEICKNYSRSVLATHGVSEFDWVDVRVA